MKRKHWHRQCTQPVEVRDLEGAENCIEKASEAPSFFRWKSNKRLEAISVSWSLWFTLPFRNFITCWAVVMSTQAGVVPNHVALHPFTLGKVFSSKNHACVRCSPWGLHHHDQCICWERWCRGCTGSCLRKLHDASRFTLGCFCHFGVSGSIQWVMGKRWIGVEPFVTEKGNRALELLWL